MTSLRPFEGDRMEKRCDEEESFADEEGWTSEEGFDAFVEDNKEKRW